MPPTPLTFEQINTRISSFTRLTAIGYSTVKLPGKRKLLFRCECGTEKELTLGEVLRGKCKSCGCLQPPHTIDAINKKLRLLKARLTAIEIVEPKFATNGEKIRMCRCVCICGKEKTARVTSLMYGSTLSCGCLDADTKTKYSHNHKQIYALWRSINDRCHNPLNRRYQDYGGKGVTMCDEWRFDYQSFLTWCLNNGWKLKYQLDKDIIGNGKIYSPNTCIFVTRETNMLYTSRAVIASYKGCTINFREMFYGLGYTPKQVILIYRQYQKHKNIDKCLDFAENLIGTVT